MNPVVIILAAFVIIATALPFVPRDEWWIRDFDFPRFQILVLGVVTTAVFPFTAGLTHWAHTATFACLVMAVLYQARRVFPYTRMARLEVLPAEHDEAKASISLLVANVLMDNRDSSRLIAIINARDPDIVLLLEPDSQWESAMRTIESRYPGRMKKPLDNTYGMLLYSKHQLLDAETRFLINDETPSMRVPLALDTGQTVRLYCVHPEPPSPTEAPESTERDAELLMVGKEVEKLDEPVIVCGDLNDVAWSSTTTLFQKISGLLDPRKGRGMYSTFNAKIPIMRWPLDHIFVSEHFRFADMQRLGKFGSDHFPVYARVILQPEQKDSQDKPTADKDDEAKAEDKLDKAAAPSDGRPAG